MASLRPSPSVEGSARHPNRRHRLAIALLMALLGALSMAACAGEPPAVTVDDPELVTGRSIYGANCASCHGADGGGGVGTRLAGGSTVDAFPDIQDQIDLVANGKGRMPAYIGRLDEDQIRAVVRYTREVL